MDALLELLTTVAAPALIAAVMVASARQRAMRAALLATGDARQGALAPLPAAGALAFAAAFVCVHVALFRELAVPSETRDIPFQHKLAWVIVGVGLVTPLMTLPYLRRVGHLLVAGVATVLVSRFGLERSFPDTAGWFVRLAVALCMYALLVWQDRTATRVPGMAAPLVWSLALAGAAVTILLARSASEAQRLGGMAAACGAVALVGLLQKRTRFPAGAILILTLVYAGALIQAWVYDLSLVAVLLLVAAVALPGLVMPRLHSERRQALAGAFLALACATAAALWTWAHAPAPNPYG